VHELFFLTLFEVFSSPPERVGFFVLVLWRFDFSGRFFQPACFFECVICMRFCLFFWGGDCFVLVRVFFAFFFTFFPFLFPLFFAGYGLPSAMGL